MKQVTLIVQFDDSAIYVGGKLVNGGDNKLVNGAADVLEALGIPYVSKRIHYDIWKTKHEGWPKQLRQVKDLV